MTGFGAVPRRGAEVGGILLGRWEMETDTIWVDDVVLAQCEHRRGPVSYTHLTLPTSDLV
mgnify:CR=1 FL=1